MQKLIVYPDGRHWCLRHCTREVGDTMDACSPLDDKAKDFIVCLSLGDHVVLAAVLLQDESD
jgi:hypothetical protein